ncbi:MAG TPA: cytochrome c [Terriglobales bacterium]|nr:cytochrome c [Terriglobales bacterium]
MKGHLVRAMLDSVVLIGLIAFCSETSQAQSPGETLFKTKCAACHGPDGKGEVPMGKKLGARDLSSAEVQSQSDAQLSDIVTKGKNKMPAYDGKLSKEQIDQLLAYIRELGKKH